MHAALALPLEGEEMGGGLMSASGIAALLLVLGLVACAVVLLLWLRLRRIRLQIESRYLAAVAEFHGSKAPPAAAEVLARIPGERARRLLQGMVTRGCSMGPASWRSRGWLRYDQDSRGRPVDAETFSIPGVWWAQIRRVRLRYLGWIDEMHQVEAGSVTSGYWWLGLYRLGHPAARSSEFALQVQALAEAVLTPWIWFDGRSIVWDDQQQADLWVGRTRAAGLGVRLSLDSLQRPRWLELTDASGGDCMRLEYAGWNWSEQGLRPEVIRLIEAPGSVNEFARLELRIGPVQRTPSPPGAILR